MSKKRYLCFLLLITLFLPLNVFASEAAIIDGLFAVLNNKINDTRVVDRLSAKSLNQPDNTNPLLDLKVGSLFINEDGTARVVTRITNEKGVITIETDTPRVDDVFNEIYIPTFEEQLTEENLVFARGVERAYGRGEKDARNMFLETEEKNRGRVEWIDTDEEAENLNIIAAHFSIPLYKGRLSPGDLDYLQRMDTASQAMSTGDYSSYDGGENDPVADYGESADTSASVSGEITLDGYLRFGLPAVKGGLKKPLMHIDWCTKYLIPFPVITFERGHLFVEIESAQQLDMNLHGQLSLEAEVKFPIAYAIIADPSGIVSANITLYAVLGAEGTLSFTFELSEYSRTTVGGKAELIWPFIPCKPTAYKEYYSNIAYSPKMTLDLGAKTGLELSGGLGLLGISVVRAYVGGGLYLDATGVAESVGPIGYDTEIGSWGSADDWRLYISVEAGAYVDIGVEILEIFDIPLYGQKWPFWQYENQWEF